MAVRKKNPRLFFAQPLPTLQHCTRGEGGFFFAPTGLETITFQADVSRIYWIAMPVAEVSHTLEIEVYPSIFVDVSALLDSSHSRSALAKFRGRIVRRLHALSHYLSPCIFSAACSSHGTSLDRKRAGYYRKGGRQSAEPHGHTSSNRRKAAKRRCRATADLGNPPGMQRGNSLPRPL